MNGAEKISKKKSRVSIIDVLIILTVIACIAATFVHYKIYEKENTVVIDEKCLVSVKYYGVDNEIAKGISMGNEVYYTENGKLLGTVIEIDSKDSDVLFKDASDKWIQTVDTTKKDVTVIIEVSGSVSSTGFLANGTDYTAAGMEIDTYSSGFSGKGLIFDVKRQAE
ncbi:MAG: DUF4330 family protein [Ruminococcaceae bacterium]|nr:DUF4330 family protein [Oscillospiraceae bacterium]